MLDLSDKDFRRLSKMVVSDTSYDAFVRNGNHISVPSNRFDVDKLELIHETFCDKRNVVKLYRGKDTNGYIYWTIIHWEKNWFKWTKGTIGMEVELASWSDKILWKKFRVFYNLGMCLGIYDDVLKAFISNGEYDVKDNDNSFDSFIKNS